MGKNEDSSQLTKDMLDKAFERFKEARNKSNSRLKSWEHCFAQFSAVLKDLKDKNRVPDDITDGEIDNLCLHLGFYLASWGMMRGSSELLQCDYKIHENAVKCILEYHELHGIDLDELCKDKKDDFEDLCKGIKEAYDWDISPILLSKIILGTIGIVPAYDGCFVEALREYGISESVKFGVGSLEKLSEYFSDKFKKEIDDYVKEMKEIAGKEGCPHYTRAKVIDSIMWFLGSEIFQKKNLSKLLSDKNIKELEKCLDALASAYK
ncbi:MAG: hypothetical protein K2N58_10180 [Treponemataceae bacterium]|nr:hypothetical protein [Treponemataceae bacterium]